MFTCQKLIAQFLHTFSDSWSLIRTTLVRVKIVFHSSILWSLLNVSRLLAICHAHRDGGSSQGGTRHSLPPVRRRGGFNSNDQLNSSTKRWWRCTGYNGLSRQSKIRQTIPLPLKWTQVPEEACFLVNYSLKQEPTKSSSLRTKCHEGPRATMCHQVPRADGCTHFYMECDVTPAVYVRMMWAQWQEGLWLAEALRAKLGRVRFCRWSSIIELRQTRPLRAFSVPYSVHTGGKVRRSWLRSRQSCWCTTYIILPVLVNLHHSWWRLPVGSWN